MLPVRDKRIEVPEWRCQWEIGKWVKVDGKLDLCNIGLHACKKPIDSLEYIYGDRWFLAEWRGDTKKGDNKFCASEMRLLKEIPLKVIKTFAVDCAEHVLPIYEKEYPNDSRVRDCIIATRNFIENPTEEYHLIMDKAWSAAGSAAESAESIS